MNFYPKSHEQNFYKFQGPGQTKQVLLFDVDMELIKNRPNLENSPISSGNLINIIPNIYEVNNNCKDESKFVFDK